jgi:hypothetical protein
MLCFNHSESVKTTAMVEAKHAKTSADLAKGSAVSAKDQGMKAQDSASKAAKAAKVAASQGVGFPVYIDLTHCLTGLALTHRITIQGGVQR